MSVLISGPPIAIRGSKVDVARLRRSGRAVLSAIGEGRAELSIALVDDPQIRELFLPCLRADIAMVETYDYRSGEPFDCPITAFYGLGDDSVRLEEATAWEQMTMGRFRGVPLPGDHFFLEGERGRICEVLAHEMAGIVEAR